MKTTRGLWVVTLFLTSLIAQNDEAVIKELKQSLMASCFHGTVADHGDANMEAKISEMVSEGKTKQEVVDYYVEMYGEQILAVPIASGFNLMAWLAPVAVFLIGVLIFFNYLKQKSLEPVTKPGSEKDKKIQYDDLIERELKERE